MDTQKRGVGNGNQLRVTMPKQKYADNNREKTHAIFSTSCTLKQDWQSYLFFFNAMVQKQRGTVTRIVSGCLPEEEAEMSRLFQERIAIMSDNFYIWFTPDFGKVPGSNWHITKYWNKPKGMKHWLENNFGYRYEGDISTPYDDDIVVLVDPDMLMLRPFVNDFAGFPLSIWKTEDYFTKFPDRLHRRVTHGYPMAQDYNFAASWLNAGRNNLTHVVGPDSPVHNVSKSYAKSFYPAGPSYLLTARDMYRVAYHWSDFLPRLFDLFDGFMVEMYAYCMAAAHLGLKHQLAKGFMISNVEMTSGEGWAFLDNVSDDACQVSKFAKNTPHVIHFCQRYSIGNCFWNKHLLPPPDILSCDCPLLELPPNDIAALVNYSRYGDGTIIYWDPDGRKLNRKYHNTYMICSIMPTLNKASMFFKDRHCPNGANYNQTWNHFSDYRPKDNL